VRHTFPCLLGSTSVNDALTGLLNPAAFRLMVEHELLVARRYQRVDTFLVIDVENMRAINAVFALDCTGDALAKRISTAVSRATTKGPGGIQRPLAVRVRIGITEIQPGEEFDDLITRAGPGAFLRAKER